MGGRGGIGTSGMGNTLSSGARVTNLGGAPDRRSEIQDMYREIGFTDVLGTNDIPTQLMGSYAIRLNQLEREYGAIAASDDPLFVAANGENYVAAVYYDHENPTSQFMAVNTEYMGNLQRNLTNQRASEASGFSPATNGSITNTTNYAITHEYGHMLENALASQSGQGLTSFAYEAQRDIMNIARTNYGASNFSTVSRYGASNSHEFFAESFASLNSGSPSAYGQAMGEWLQTHKLK